jgi:hypothetical protein
MGDLGDRVRELGHVQFFPQDLEAMADEVDRLERYVVELDAAFDDAVSNPRDQHHTMAELYEYRMLYNAFAARFWADQGKAVKSRRHHDGELCFDGQYFIVVADLHPYGQVSNHYPVADWDLFHVHEVERAPQWDGHTPAEAASRMRAALWGATI